MKPITKLLVAVFWIAAAVSAWMKRADAGVAGEGRGRADAAADQPLPDESAEAAEKPRKRKRWRRLWQAVGLLVLLAGGGFAVAASGTVPIKANSGHWPVTAWFLNFSMSRSVSTYSAGTKVPPLEDEGLILKGAGHFETGCRACHGSPGLRRPRIAAAMTPHPPYLPPKIAQWDPEELFYIVKHGVKFTGMPAWPSQQREDEVWAMVAFLQQFPELDAAGYRELALGQRADQASAEPLSGLAGPDTVPPAVKVSCQRCHGGDGNGRGEGAFPKLAGQPVEYLAATLEAYAEGDRHSGMMEPIAAGLTAAEWRGLAEYYSQLEPATRAPKSSAEDEARIARGQSIAQDGVPAEKIPACVDCHGPSEFPISEDYPRLSGQYSDYIVLQLELFKKQHRGGTSFADLMHPVAKNLTEAQMRDVAAYYQSLGGD